MSTDLEPAARELLRLDAEATPGPWVLRRTSEQPRFGAHPWQEVRSATDRTGVIVADAYESNRDGTVFGVRISDPNAQLVAAARNTAPALARAYLAVCKVLEDNGCDCDCEHHPEEHDDDCVRCLACRVELAMLHAAPPAPYATAREAFGVGR